MPSLSLCIQGQKVGELQALPVQEDPAAYTLAFHYSQDWEKTGFPLSPHIPFGTHSKGPSVWKYFANLLPEGNVLADVAARYSCSQRDVFSLLSHIGADCAGAFSLLPKECPALETAQYRPIRAEELQSPNLPHSRQSLLNFHGNAHMSLAGAQDKLGVFYDAQQRALFLPLGATPSTHILKPECKGPFAHSVINEHFIMTLAGKVGIAVPRSRVLRFEGQTLYLVERFDREYRDGHWQRLHQIDACQFFDRGPTQKYEHGEFGADPKGLKLADCFQLARCMSSPMQSVPAMLHWCIFNYLVGNTDAHGKNIAVLVHKDATRLAPFYDLLCVRVYGEDYNSMAFEIGGEDALHWISESSWAAMATECQISFRQVHRVLQSLARALLLHSKALLASPEFTHIPPTERALLHEIAALIQKQVQRSTGQ